MNNVDKIQSYRHPITYSTGVLLGFSLNTGARWVATAFSTNRVAEYIVAIMLLVHIPLYIIVIYRALNIDYPRDRAEAYHRRTLRILIAALLISFLSLILITIESAIINNPATN